MCDVNIIKELLLSKKDIIETIYSNVISSICVYKIDNRMTCRLSGPSLKKTILYSRLSMEIHLSKKLDYDETVDHIDGDPLNDEITNLQILSRSENSTKGPSKIVKLKILEYNSKRMYLDPNISGEKCNLHKLSEKEVLEIRELQKSYVKGSGQDKIISEHYNVSDKTINRIRNNKIWKHI